MCTIIINLKPEMAMEVLKGKVTDIFRKRHPKEVVTKILVYVPYPVRKLLMILEVSPHRVVTMKQYHTNKTFETNAFGITKVTALKNPIGLDMLGRLLKFWGVHGVGFVYLKDRPNFVKYLDDEGILKQAPDFLDVVKPRIKCKATTNNGNNCRNYAKINGYCMTHARIVLDYRDENRCSAGTCTQYRFQEHDVCLSHLGQRTRLEEERRHEDNLLNNDKCLIQTFFEFSYYEMFHVEEDSELREIGIYDQDIKYLKNEMRSFTFNELDVLFLTPFLDMYPRLDLRARLECFLNDLLK